MLDAFLVRSTIGELIVHPIRLLGTGALDPTVECGKGISVAYVTTGEYTITWSENPGTFVGMSYGLGAATPANIAGHTVIHDTYNTTAFSLDVWFYNASDAAHDPAANEYLELFVHFAQSGVSLT